MRKCVRDFVRIFAEAVPAAEPIYEFGSFQASNSGASVDLRPIFPGKEYVGCDMREGPGVDMILNLHDMALPAETAATVLVLETLEHVEYPHKAMEEVYRITRPDGMVLISSVMNFPIHEYPFDYWRFTPEAFRSLLRPFHSSLVGFAGEHDFPHTVFGIACKGAWAPTNDLVRQIESWKKRWFYQEGNPWRQIRRQFTPPIVRTARKRIKRLLRESRAHRGGT